MANTSVQPCDSSTTIRILRKEECTSTKKKQKTHIHANPQTIVKVCTFVFSFKWRGCGWDISSRVVFWSCGPTQPLKLLEKKPVWSAASQSTNGKSIALDRQLDIIDIYRDCNVCHRKSLLICKFNSMKNIRFYPSVKVQSIRSWGAGLQDWTYSVQGSHLTWHKYEINKFRRRFQKWHMSQWMEHDVAPFHLYMLSFDQSKQAMT